MDQSLGQATSSLLVLGSGKLWSYTNEEQNKSSDVGKKCKYMYSL